jgi:RNA polymerase sigma-70 factor (ECF subfamily)
MQMAELDLSPEGAPQTSAAGDDREHLVRRAQMGSAAAFEQLVVAHGAGLYRYLCLRLHDENDARDALQESLAAAWVSLPTLREPARFWPWLVAIARHKAADLARTRTPSASRVEAGSRSDESAIEIREALDRLPPRFREILLLRFGLELSEQDTAEVLGIRVGTVKSRSARARRALEELLR